jgi:tetratricopeptide (TPR) repeat protein
MITTSWPRNAVRLVRYSVVPAFVIAAACGGGNAEQDKPKVADNTSQDTKPTGPSNQEQAAAKFAAISDMADRVGEDKSVDATWLETQLNEVIALDPKHKAARYDLAVIKEQRGDLAGAKAIYQQLYKEDPSFAPAAENVAADMVVAGDTQKALQIYAGIAQKDPKDTPSRLAMARIALREKRYDDAIDLCRQVLQREGKAMEAFRILADSYRAAGNLPMAELIIARGLKVDKDDMQLHYTLAQIRFEKNDLPGGVNELKLAVAQDPKSVKVRGQLADIALQYRDFGNASQNFEAIVKEQPDNSGAKVGLAVSYKGLGRYDQAEKLYQEVLAKNPDDLDALWNLALLYHHNLNKYDDAITLYRKAQKQALPGDEKMQSSDSLIADAEHQKNDQAAQQAREAAEKKRREAVDGVCQAVAAKKKPDFDSIGDESERIEAAWALMVSAQGTVQEAANAGDMSKVAGADAQVQCAYAIVPESPKANSEACAPMHIMWTQILYQLNRLDDAMTSIKAARKCDPENPDAKLIEQQLQEMVGSGGGQGSGAR